MSGRANRRYLVSGLLVLAAIVFVAVQVLMSQDDGASAPQSAPPSAETTPSPSPMPLVPSTTLSAQPNSQVSESPDAQPCLPVRLVIPRIGVDTVVLALGSTAEGAPAVPDNPTQVSWWKVGVVPGNPGSAGVQGHTWSQGDGVFDELGELHQNDVIRLHGTNCALTFTVEHVERHVDPNLSGPALDKYYRVSGKPGVTLVTCGDYKDGEYDSRVVVRAGLATKK